MVASRASGQTTADVRQILIKCGTGLGLSLIGFALSESLWLSAFFAATAGGLMLTISATANTCIQQLVPDKLRGRTMSLYTTMYVGAIPFGHLFAGPLAGKAGAQLAVVVAGVATVGTTVLFAGKIPSEASRVEEVSIR